MSDTAHSFREPQVGHSNKSLQSTASDLKRDQ